MIQYRKQLIRVAIELHNQLRAAKKPAESLMLPSAVWTRCESLHRQMRIANHHDWRAAGQRKTLDLIASLKHLQLELSLVERSLEADQCNPGVQSPHEIHADLLMLEEEFGDLQCDWHAKSIAVVTEAIELEDIYLGEFEIQLDLHNLAIGQPLSYRVIAQDPRPSTPNDSVTHPHVQDENLCEGEGQPAIRQALQQGRLLDFFVIVANLLRTYNSGSPFVSLASWHGMLCSDCGRSMADDEQWTCEKCDTNVCEECRYLCPDCGYSYCSECVARCEDCDEFYCGTCICLCSRCHTETCRTCLDDHERCAHCHDQETEHKPEPQADAKGASETSTNVVEVHSHRLGETSLLT